MRKLSAILLLAVLLFNLVGYRAWFYYREIRSVQNLQATVNSNAYDDKDLITLKVPLSLPYFTNWKEFEQYDGTIEVNGEHYNYVKRKVSNDTLILLCLPNQEQNKLNESKNIFENLVSNSQSADHNNKSGATLLLSGFFNGYRQSDFCYQFCAPAPGILHYIVVNDNIIPPGSITSPWQPPDTRC